MTTLVLCCGFENLPQLLAGETGEVRAVQSPVPAYSLAAQGQALLFAQAPSTKVALARAVTLLLKTHPVTRLICLGCAGALSLEPEPGAIAIGGDALQYDVDFVGLGYPAATVPHTGASVFACDKSLITAAQSAAAALELKCHVGRFVSADRFLACDTQRHNLRAAFLADFADTESGSAGELAAAHDLPFAIIKGVSNFANYRADADHPLYRAKACELAFHVCIEGLTKPI